MTTYQLTDKQRAKFLAIITADRSIGNRRALRQAGITLTAAGLDALLADDEDFRADYDAARGRDHEDIRAEIRRRAIDGVPEPVFYRGTVVGEVAKFSDRMLELMARAVVPEYRDTKSVDITTGGVPLTPEMTQRGVSLAEVLAVLETAGATRDGSAVPGEEVPAAGEVLAEPLPEP